MNTLRRTARLCTAKPVSLVARGLGLSGLAHLIARAARRIGLRSKIRMRQRCGAKPKKIGADDGRTMMLKSISDEIRDLYKQAEHCARQAAEQTDPWMRENYLTLETGWLKLARLYERDTSDRIRVRAYEMWIATGRGGEAEQHWLAAEREILSALEREILSALQSTKSSVDFRVAAKREAEEDWAA